MALIIDPWNRSKVGGTDLLKQHFSPITRTAGGRESRSVNSRHSDLCERARERCTGNNAPFHDLSFDSSDAAAAHRDNANANVRITCVVSHVAVAHSPPLQVRSRCWTIKSTIFW